MSIIEKDKGRVKEQEEDYEPIYRVYPDIYRDVDHEKGKITLEIALPGVKKENISVKALPTWVHLDAKRERIEYSANQDWGAEIVPEKTQAKYDNGLLQIIAKIKDPFEDAVKVQL